MRVLNQLPPVNVQVERLLCVGPGNVTKAPRDFEDNCLLGSRTLTDFMQWTSRCPKGVQGQVESFFTVVIHIHYKWTIYFCFLDASLLSPSFPQ